MKINSVTAFFKYELLLLIIGLIVIIGCSKSSSIAETTDPKNDVDIIITYNIKNDYDKTGPNNWTDRKQALVQLMKELSPTFIGVQEALENQVKFIDDALIKHAVIGVGRDDGKNAGEYCAIYYDTTRYKIIDSRTIWLSTKPNEISTGWDAALPRIATFGLFIDATKNDSILVVNTHFDHIGEQARVESARLIVKEMQNWPVQKKVLMGDFNATADQEPIQLLNTVLTNTQKLSPTINNGPIGTFNGFNQNFDDRVIDFIFLDGFPNNVVKDYQHIDKRLDNGDFVSDHFAVLAKIVH